MSWRRDLEALRDGEIRFVDFEARHRARFARWAGYFMRRWPQTTHDEDDLIQEGMIAAWRAVDRWEPGRGADIVRFVDYQVGSAMQTTLKKTVGWPNKKAGRSRVWMLPIDSAPEASLEDRDFIDVARTAALFSGIHRDVVAGVGHGVPAPVVAAHIYSDPDRRFRYRLDSEPDSVRKVKRALREVTREIAEEMVQ